MSLEEYKIQVAEYLMKYMNYSDEEIEDVFEMYEDTFSKCLKRGISVPSMATMIYNEF